jgi:Protein phosphatase 2C
MTTQHISRAPDGGINEDLIAVFESGATTDLLVLDGATSVADANYIDPRQGDVAWFVQAFASEMEGAIAANLSQGAAVRKAVDAVHRRYRALAAGAAIPLYAHPLAALTWIRVRRMADHLDLSLYCLGDCKAFAIDGAGAVRDLDPYVNPYEAVLHQAIGALDLADVSDPAAKRARLLPMLRARREAQHRTPAPESLCLAPQGEFKAREHALRLPLESAVLAMTDGFYRLVDPYGLYAVEELAQRCRSLGLAALLDELRAHENARANAALAVKSADDASALLWRTH